MKKIIELDPHNIVSQRQFSIRSGQIAANYSLSETTDGIVPFLRAFDRKLFFGFMHQDLFIFQNYLNAKESLIQKFRQLEALPPDDSRSLAFHLHMIRVAQQGSWQFPAIFNRDPLARIQQQTGSTRAIASGLIYDEPWLHYPILFTEQTDLDATELLEDPVCITSDEHLHEVLQLPYESQDWQAKIHLDFVFTNEQNRIWCKLHYIGEGYHYHHAHPTLGQDLLQEHKNWRAQYPLPAKLCVYTQWPDRLINRYNLWDVSIEGSSEGVLLDERPGTAERIVRAYHHSPVHGSDHVLWVIKPRTIDIDDLLMWVDTKHSTYISDDWSFILYRRQDDYKNTFVNISRQTFK